MAKLNPKIVVFKEEGLEQAEMQKRVDKCLSAASIKRAEVLDAVETMQTDFKPTPDKTVLTSPEIGVSTMDLSDEEAANLIKQSDVLEVLDDETVYAIGPYDRPGAAGLVTEELDKGILELDDAEIEALDDEINDVISREVVEEEGTRPADLELLMQRAPAPVPEEYDAERTLRQLTDQAQVGLAGPLDSEPPNLASAMRGVFKFMTELKRPLDEVTDVEIETVLRQSRFVEALRAPWARLDLIPLNIRMVFSQLAWRLSTGTGSRLAIVDTGIAPHRDLRIFGGASFVPRVTSWRDDNGHGTHVAGTAAALLNDRGLAGVAPNAQLYAVKVLNRNGSGSSSSVLNGLLWCYRARMHVVNLSLGSRWPRHNPREYNTAYERMGRLLRSHGTLPVAAAGNTPGPVGNPARCPSFMAVSAIDYFRRRATFSSYGPQVEICAPGVNIVSTWPANYNIISGTSMACPHVAGTAALVKSRHPSWTGDAIRQRIKRAALDLGYPGHDWLYGSGQVNAYRASF